VINEEQIKLSIVKANDTCWQIRSSDEEKALLSFDNEESAKRALAEIKLAGAQDFPLWQCSWICNHNILMMQNSVTDEVKTFYRTENNIVGIPL
jgi:hypothetical protein